MTWWHHQTSNWGTKCDYGEWWKIWKDFSRFLVVSFQQDGALPRVTLTRDSITIGQFQYSQYLPSFSHLNLLGSLSSTSLTVCPFFDQECVLATCTLIHICRYLIFKGVPKAAVVVDLDTLVAPLINSVSSFSSDAFAAKPVLMSYLFTFVFFLAQVS